jgi:DNA repair protein RadC
MTPQEETVILEARDILGRYLSQNPVIGSWQALMDYCALAVRGPVERFHVLYLLHPVNFPEGCLSCWNAISGRSW